MGIPRYPDSDGPTTRPAKRGDETEIEFRQRELAWQTSRSGVGSGTVGGLGIPADTDDRNPRNSDGLGLPAPGPLGTASGSRPEREVGSGSS